jgi:hypothetical protein
MEPSKQIISKSHNKICIDYVEIILAYICCSHKITKKNSTKLKIFIKTLTVSNIGTKHTNNNKIFTSHTNSKLEASKDMGIKSMAIFNV